MRYAASQQVCQSEEVLHSSANQRFESRSSRGSRAGRPFYVKILVPHVAKGGKLGIMMDGLVVKSVDAEAAPLGWCVGDRIVKVNDNSVLDASEFRKSIGRAMESLSEKGKTIAVSVVRQPGADSGNMSGGSQPASYPMSPSVSQTRDPIVADSHPSLGTRTPPMQSPSVAPVPQLGSMRAGDSSPPLSPPTPLGDRGTLRHMLPGGSQQDLGAQANASVANQQGSDTQASLATPTLSQFSTPLGNGISRSRGTGALELPPTTSLSVDAGPNGSQLAWDGRSAIPSVGSAFDPDEWGTGMYR